MATDRRPRDVRLAEVIRALRIAKPHSLKAVNEAGDETPVVMSGQRGLYERAARTLIALGAVVAHCVNKEGQVTETINVMGSNLEDAERSADNAKVRTREQELRGLLAVTLEAQDKMAGRYEAMLKAHADMAERTTNAAISVMKVAADRAKHLESAVLRLTLTREQELNAREHELAKLARDIQRADDEGDDASGETETDPVIREIIDIAKHAMTGEGKKKPEAANE